MNTITKKEINSWMLYDFANSAYATTILAVIFNKYFAQVVAGGEAGIYIAGMHIQGAAFFTFTISISMTIVALMSPILGAIADYSGSKKEFLIFFALLGIGFTGGLFFIYEGDYWLGALLFIMSQIGFSGANVFYNSYLPDISDETNVGKISGIGWAIGYIGGGVLLAINLYMLDLPLFSSREQAIHWCFLSVSVWWLIFSIPLMKNLKNYQNKQELPARKSYLNIGLSRVKKTFGELKKYKTLSRFLAAYLLYNDGIQTVITMASIFGAQVVGMETKELVVFFLMIQFTAFFGALIFGYVVDKIGCKETILASLLGWCIIVVWAFFLGIVWSEKTEYWILGVLVGLVMGGSQAASRTLQAILTPEEKSAEFFGFFAVAGKFSSVFGPLIYGLILSLTGSLRYGILSLIVFFIAGFIILYSIDINKGIQEKALVTE